MIATAQYTITKVYDGQESYSVVKASKVPSNPTASLIISRSGFALNPLQSYNPTGALTTFPNNNIVEVSGGQQPYCYYADTQILGDQIIVYTPASTVITDVDARVADMGDDDKITPLEKQSLKVEWDTIQDEYSKLTTIAGTFTDNDYNSDVIQATFTYIEKYTALSSYVTSILADLTTTYDLGKGCGVVYRTTLTDYYTARNSLSTAISSAMKLTYESKFIAQADKIGMIITESNGDSIIDSASIVAAINNGNSKIDISATNINLNGYVTLTDLSASGSTTINGGNITTGKIQSANTYSYLDISNNKFRLATGASSYLLDFNGTTLSFGSGVSISWDNISKTGATAADVGARPNTWTPTASQVGALPTTMIDANNVFTGNVYASKITGNTLNITDYLQFVKGSTTLFKIGINSAGNSGQLFLNDSCSLDTNGSDLRMRVASNNYIRINSNGGFDYYFPTGSATYKVVPIVDSNGNLCSTAGTTTLVFG